MLQVNYDVASHRLMYTLKNKGASRCHRITFLSKLFHKDPLTFLFHKRFFVVKEGSSDYEKVRKRCFFKEPLTEWFFVEPKTVLLWHYLKNLLKHLYKMIYQLLRVYSIKKKNMLNMNFHFPHSKNRTPCNHLILWCFFLLHYSGLLQTSAINAKLCNPIQIRFSVADAWCLLVTLRHSNSNLKCDSRWNTFSSAGR